MGNTFTKHFIIYPQHYYYDMVSGFFSDAGGQTYILDYPKHLLSLPKKCEKCGRASGLKHYAMIDRLLEKQRQYREKVNEAIRKRIASGDPYPYLGYSKKALEEKMKAEAAKIPDEPKQGPSSSGSTPKLLRYLKLNEVVPEEEEEDLKKCGGGGGDYDGNSLEECEARGVIHFPVESEDLVICKHCEKLERFKVGGDERPDPNELTRWRIRTRSMEWQTPPPRA